MPGVKYIVGDENDPGVLPRLAGLETALTAWKAEGQQILNQALASISEKRAGWIDYETRVEARIQTIVEELRSKGVTPALAEVNRLAEQEAKASTAIQRADKDTGRLAELRKARKQLLAEYRQAQSRRYYLRAEASKKLTAALNASLKEFKVKITYSEGARVDSYEKWIRGVLGQRAFKADRMTRFCRVIHPIDLADALRRKAVGVLQAVKDGDSAYFSKESDASEFISLFEAADLHELEEIAMSDLPQITLTTLIGDKLRVVPFDNLSHGQKASVLLGALLFADDSTPLIIDQPEDHLDSAFIFETVVQNLRRVKEQRQVILATHNANIAVLGDAELIVPLAGYQGRGVVVDAGSVDNDVTSKRACKVLEGGAGAYARRGEMYGLTVSGV